MILILYVDDLLLLGEDLHKIEDVKRQLGKLYQMKDRLILFGDSNYQKPKHLSHLD